MYSGIGKKIKILAYILAGIEASICLYYGLAFSYGSLLVNLLILTVGPGLAWAFSWLVYGFGELIDKMCDIERNTRGGTKKSETQAKIDEERTKRIENLRARGLITEDEYRYAIYNE